MNQNDHIIHGIEAKKTGGIDDQKNKVRCLTLNFLIIMAVLSGYKVLLVV